MPLTTIIIPIIPQSAGAGPWLVHLPARPGIPPHGGLRPGLREAPHAADGAAQHPRHDRVPPLTGQLRNVILHLDQVFSIL